MKTEKIYRLIKSKNFNTVLKTFFLLFLILWMVFIFTRSSKIADESNKESGRFVDATGEIMESLTNKPVINKTPINHKVRKAAHFIEYALLGALAFINVVLWAGKSFFAMLLSLAFCFITACSDELLQTYVDGRAGSLKDVLIDCCGALFGMIFICCLYVLLKKSLLNKRLE